MSSISNLLLPNVLLIEEEVKICHGCMQDHMWKKLPLNKEELGLKTWWYSSYKWGNGGVSTYTFQHIDNHPDCVNYEIKIIQKIIYHSLVQSSDQSITSD